eukprot:3667723-Alexandrium_andersonii.AAC.1
MFAATPQLEALRVLLSDLATSGCACVRWRCPGAWGALFVDARKAHLRAFVHEDVHVALPPEAAEPGMRAKLARAEPARGPGCA